MRQELLTFGEEKFLLATNEPTEPASKAEVEALQKASEDAAMAGLALLKPDEYSIPSDKYGSAKTPEVDVKLGGKEATIFAKGDFSILILGDQLPSWGNFDIGVKRDGQERLFLGVEWNTKDRKKTFSPNVPPTEFDKDSRHEVRSRTVQMQTLKKLFDAIGATLPSPKAPAKA